MQKAFDQTRMMEVGVVEGTARMPAITVNTHIDKWVNAANIR
jgi:hypothetical protein